MSVVGESHATKDRGRLFAGADAFPESVMERIRELEDAYPDVTLRLAGGLEALVEREDGRGPAGLERVSP